MQNLTADVAELYPLLVPSREEGLLIIRLHEKIKNDEIDNHFSLHDIQRAVEETNSYTIGGQPNRERLLKNLLNYFIERPPEQRNRYMLTEYARKFILLIDHKLNSPFRKFPLRDSFQRYTNFSAQDIRHINQFESWFSQGFQATTRENIFEHLEELKSDVQASVHRLNKLLYSGSATVQQMVAEFSVIFTDLGNNADEIREALRLGNNLELQVEMVVTLFYQQTQELGRPSTEDETAALKEATYAYERAEEIQQEIRSFFGIVDGKLSQLRERISYAITKLNELQDIFRYQSQYKLNLKKLLEHMLTIAKPKKNNITLPDTFPLKGIVEERFRLTVMPDLEHEFAQRNSVVTVPYDEHYFRQEMASIETELSRQQRSAVLVDQYREGIEKEGRLDFTAEFYHILEREQDEELAVQVGYELLTYIHEHPKFQVDILPEIAEVYRSKPILTWMTNLKRRK